MSVAPASCAEASVGERLSREAIARRATNRPCGASGTPENRVVPREASVPGLFLIDVEPRDSHFLEQHPELAQRAVVPGQQGAERLFEVV